MTNRLHGTLYVGVTNSLMLRVWQHKSKILGGFTKSYGLNLLVYFEEFYDVRNAIRREKQLKGWLRRKKIDLIRKKNPFWHDLSIELFGPD